MAVCRVVDNIDDWNLAHFGLLELFVFVFELVESKQFLYVRYYKLSILVFKIYYKKVF